MISEGVVSHELLRFRRACSRFFHRFIRISSSLLASLLPGPYLYIPKRISRFLLVSLSIVSTLKTGTPKCLQEAFQSNSTILQIPRNSILLYYHQSLLYIFILFLHVSNIFKPLAVTLGKKIWLSEKKTIRLKGFFWFKQKIYLN